MGQEISKDGKGLGTPHLSKEALPWWIFGVLGGMLGVWLSAAMFLADAYLVSWSPCRPDLLVRLPPRRAPGRPGGLVRHPAGQPLLSVGFSNFSTGPSIG